MKKDITYNLKKWEAAEALFAACFGTIWHFVYEWSGKTFLLGLVSPVNESVFEHLKLLIIPVFLFTFLEYCCLTKLRGCILWKKWESMAAGVCFIIVFYYCYTGILQKEIAWLDIASFYGAVMFNSFLAYRLLQKPCDGKRNGLAGRLAWVVTILLTVLGTVYPPTDILPGLFVAPDL